MKTIRPAFLLGCLVFLSAGTSYGQVLAPRSYLFVEVKDAAGQAVSDATVTVSNVDGKQIASQTTDKGGVAHPHFRPTSDHHYDVEVSKSGYLPSEYVFFSTRGSEPLVEGFRDDFNVHTPVIVWLRKTPVTTAERQAVEVEEQKYQLLLAAKRGDPESLRKLLQAGVKADTADTRGVPAIAWAAFSGDAETIKALLAANARVRNKTTLEHQTLLIYLAEGLPRERKARTPEGDSQTGSGKTLLEQHEEIVLKLIKAGAGINEQTSNWGTVLNNAILQVPDFLSGQTIKALLAAGAKVNVADEIGARTPLMLAAQTSSLETVKTLLKAGASVNAKDKSARTPLMWAQTSLHYPGHYNPETVKALIAARADVNALDEYGQTPLMLAAEANLLDSVEMLLRAGAKASINAKDKRGDTALIHAFNSIYYSPKRSAGQFSAIVKALIAAGANINDTNVSGRTPLMLAAQTNSLEAVKMLLAAGAPIDAKDKSGRTVLMYDELWYHFPGVEVIKVLIAAKADLHAVDEHGRTPLMLAAQGAPIEIVRAMLEAKSPISVKDKWGRTALFFACYSSALYSAPAVRELVAKSLIDAGANVNEVDGSGQTPLMVAALFGFNDLALGIVKVLIAAGANVNIKDNQGQTALTIARQAGQAAMVRLLEEVPKP